MKGIFWEERKGKREDRVRKVRGLNIDVMQVKATSLHICPSYAHCKFVLDWYWAW